MVKKVYVVFNIDVGLIVSVNDTCKGAEKAITSDISYNKGLNFTNADYKIFEMCLGE